MNLAFDETVAVPIDILADGWDKQGLLIYRPIEPLSVTLRLFVSASRSMDWEMSYDMFKYGSFSPTPLGPGRYRIRRWDDCACLSLPLPNKTEKMVLIKLFYVRRFLRRVKPYTFEIDDAELQKFIEGE